jgi:phage recombination protein Bet
MTGTGNALATRNGQAPAQAAPGAALELRSGQTMWTKDQHAALVAMGIPREASSAELGVFLHQCQRTGLDPFSKQIYLIYRPSFENGRNVMKPTTQVGIDGFRVIRDRIARRDGLRVEYGDTIWYAADGQAYDVWLWDEPPAACKFTVLVDGRRFPATLRFAEYVQRKKDGGVNKMWTEKAAHMIEKCAEADALRRAFPNDMAGVILEDAAPLAEDLPEAPRPRVTADMARARGSQTVTAEVVTPGPSPAAPDDAPSGPQVSPSSAAAAGGAHLEKARKAAHAQARSVFGTDRDARLLWTARILRLEDGAVKSYDHLTVEELAQVVGALSQVGNVAELEALLKTGEVPGE